MLKSAAILAVLLALAQAGPDQAPRLETGGPRGATAVASAPDADSVVRGMYLAYKAADWHESRGRASTSPIAVVADKIAGRP